MQEEFRRMKLPMARQNVEDTFDDLVYLYRTNTMIMIESKMMVYLSLFAPEHLLLIAFVVLLLFGGRKIPELMKGLGKGIREFNDAKATVKDHIESGMTEVDIKEKQAEIELREAKLKLAEAEAKLQQTQQAQQVEHSQLGATVQQQSPTTP